MKNGGLLLFLVLTVSTSFLQADWNSDLSAFRQKKEQLSAKDAAEAWVGLAAGLPGSTEKKNHRENLKLLVESLPGPEAWPFFRESLDKASLQPEGYAVSVSALVAFLHGSEAERWEALHALEASSANAESAGHVQGPGFWESIKLIFQLFFNKGGPSPELMERFLPSGYSFSELQNFLLQSSTDPVRIETELRRRIGQDQQQDFSGQLEIPDLVALLGKDKARSLLRSLLLSDRDLTFNSGDGTRQLARELALEEVMQLKKAPWELSRDLDAEGLFQALEKRFPESGDFDYEQAKLYHLYRLVIRKKTAQAVETFLKETNPELLRNNYTHTEILRDLERRGYSTELQLFLRELLARMDHFPYWENFARLSARLGKQDELMDLAEKNLKKNDQAGQLEALRALFTCALASDRVDRARESFAQVRKRVSAGAGDEEFYGDYAAMADTWLRACQLHPSLKPDEESAFAAAREALGLFKEEDDYQAGALRLTLLGAYEARGRIKDAEALVEDFLKTDTKDDFAFRQEAPSGLMVAADFYVRHKQGSRVVALLDKDSRWGVSDLAQLLHQEAQGSEAPLAYLAVRSLEQTERPKEALRILSRLLAEATPYDPAYEFAFERFSSTELLSLLDRGIASDRFEERPLIWKAEWLRREKRLDEALATIRQAVAIDPSDGEIGKGRRMTAYVVWGRIAEDQGDGKTAALMKNVEKAIRLAESGDDFEKAGLSTRAIALYEQSLGLFSDAYCIQSRLALRLSEEGRTEEAARHYEKAFELMPDSFGRMESHCFGCEGAFEGKTAESTAEKVFTRLLAKTPGKPQLHYLMGYLREENGRPEESLKHYRKAVELDPDYLNAWKKLGDLSGKTRVPVELQDRATLRLLELDPRGLHVQPRISSMSDLAALWLAMRQREDSLRHSREPLYSFAAVEKSGEKKKGNRSEEWQREYLSDYGPLPETAGEALTRHRALRKILQIAGQSLTAGS